MAIQDIQAGDLRELIRNKKDQIEIIDVRQPEEYEVIHIRGSKLIPLGELQSRINEIDWKKEVVFVCRSGSRSKMAAMLSAGGRPACPVGREVKNLEYGIFECQADGKGEFLETSPEMMEDYF